ncbi:MAG: orotidine 5'-phosphate decarboxylase, partial [Planctomycetota bacterium]|nr:orotidine 5'-phosphate decarboxylase [Planctomycetota bacterium]
GRGDSLSVLRSMKQIDGARISIAGGITLQMAAEALEFGADAIVVGGAIIGNDNPAEAARAFHNQIMQSK